MILLIAIVSTITGFVFGFDEGIISGILESITQEFHLSTGETGLMMGLLPFGALVAACVSGRFSDWVGRLHVLYLVAVLFCIGLLGILIAHSFIFLCTMRFILGISIGMSVVVTPLYIAETATAEMRGKLVSYFQLAITLGILCSYAVNLFMVGNFPWRYIFATGLIPSVALFIGALFLPESPRWLYMKGRTKDAHNVMLKLQGSKARREKIEHELNTIKESLKVGSKVGMWHTLFSRKCLPSLILGLALFFFQQASGINAIIYYAPIIFHAMHLTSTSVQLLATVGIGTINVLMTFVAIRYVERLGRRPLLILGFIGVAISLGLIAFATQFDGVFFQWLSAISIFLFIGSFAFALGPLPYVMASEVFPIKVRGQGMSLSAASSWGFNTLVVSSFPILLHGMGISFIFLLYASACVVGLLFTLRYVPETKGISLEKIEKHVQSGKALRTLGR